MAAAQSGDDDSATRAAVTAERGLLAALEAGCSAPVGAFASDATGGRLRLDGMVLGTGAPEELDVLASSEMIVVREHGEADSVRLAFHLAARILSRGAARLVGAPGSAPASSAPASTATINRDDAHD
jgi:hydroxymethylbilane synthase